MCMCMCVTPNVVHYFVKMCSAGSNYFSIHGFSWVHSGIPISHQHLIWQSTELEDEFCLHDYNIHSGATLKLVLAVRGGPINTRRSMPLALPGCTLVMRECMLMFNHINVMLVLADTLLLYILG